MKVKAWEAVLVFIILGIVLVISSGYVVNIIEKANKSGTESQVTALSSTIEQMYIEALLENKNVKPFIAEFVNFEMYIKSGNPPKSYIYDGKIKMGGTYPKSGSIIIDDNQAVIIKDLTIRNYICNKELNKDLICKKA